MNILFLNLIKFASFQERNIYTDLLRQFMKDGHNVCAVCPSERRYGEKTNLRQFGSSAILTVKTFNIQKTNVIEKGIGMLAIKRQFVKAIKKYFKGIKFDLILYPTPPITLYGVVKIFKKRDSAKTYLMLKDIFPQNAVDLNIIKRTGLKGFIYRYFRRQEKELYAVSDRIGCLSPANVEYLLKHNPEITKEKVEVFPNCLEIHDTSISVHEKRRIREKYSLPFDKKVFVYGGNLGKPQDIPFIIDCIKKEKDNKEAFFLVIGDGTEFSKLEQFAADFKQKNFMLVKRLPPSEFDKVVASCDVGLIFLDHRFTIPNYPSRLLSYMQARLPTLACTDVATDIGQAIIQGRFGWWCESNNSDNFKEIVDMVTNKDLIAFGEAAYRYLEDNFSCQKLYKKIIKN